MLYIEVNYFFTWLASICIVLMYFYLVKFRSPYNPEHLTDQGFIENENGEKEAYFWTDKNSDDFLKYIKREMFEVAYLLTSTIMTFSVMEYGHLWTIEKKHLPFVQKAICVLLNVERLTAIILKLRYLHSYLTCTKEERHSRQVFQVAVKFILNLFAILFWFYDIFAVTHELKEYSVLVRFWLYFSIMTIAAEPIILNFFLPWIKQEDDEKLGDRQDKYVKSNENEGKDIRVELVEMTENVADVQNPLALAIGDALTQDVKHY